jgi:hypothetical protein
MLKSGALEPKTKKNEKPVLIKLAISPQTDSYCGRLVRLWWNWQTRYFEVVVEQSVEVQILSDAPFFWGKRLPLTFYFPAFSPSFRLQSVWNSVDMKG